MERDPNTQQQIAELEEERTIHYKRLRQLQLQKATFGVDTPAHIKIEIADIEEKIASIDAIVTKLLAAEAKWLARIVPPTQDGEVTTGSEELDQLIRLGRYVIMLEDSIRRSIRGIVIDMNQREDFDLARRKKREIRTDLFYLSIIFLLVVVVLIELLK